MRQRATALLKARWTRAALGPAALVAVGWLVPSLYVRQLRTAGARLGDGIDARAGDRIAEQAEAAALAAVEHPISRLLTPHRVVTDIWRDPSHCAADEPGGSSPEAAYRATVRFFGWFAIPGPVVFVRCGGASWERSSRIR